MQGRGEKGIFSLTIVGFKTKTPRSKDRLTEEEYAPHVLDVIFVCLF